MKHFTLDQIIEVQIHAYYNKNKGFATAPLPILPKENQVVYLPVLEIKDQFSPIQKSEKI